MQATIATANNVSRSYQEYSERQIRINQLQLAIGIKYNFDHKCQTQNNNKKKHN